MFSGMLCRVKWWTQTCVSEQPTAPVVRTDTMFVLIPEDTDTALLRNIDLFTRRDPFTVLLRYKSSARLLHVEWFAPKMDGLHSLERQPSTSRQNITFQKICMFITPMWTSNLVLTTTVTSHILSGIISCLPNSVPGGRLYKRNSFSAHCFRTGKVSRSISLLNGKQWHSKHYAPEKTNKSQHVWPWLHRM